MIGKSTVKSYNGGIEFDVIIEKDPLGFGVSEGCSMNIKILVGGFLVGGFLVASLATGFMVFESSEPVLAPPTVEVTQVVASVEADGELEDLGTRKSGNDWNVFLGPNGDSKSRETGIITDWGGKGLKLLWERDLGSSYGMGTVSKGRYYQFDRVDNKAFVVCLNAETGKELWKFQYTSGYEDLYGYDPGPRCSPLVDRNRVFIYGTEGMVYCLNATTGKEEWSVDTIKKFGVIQNFFGVGSNPVIEGDLLICMVGGSPDKDKQIPPGQLDLVTPNGTGIVAFNKSTGKVEYQVIDDLASYSSLKLATIGDRRWCFAFTRGGLTGFDPASGAVDFEYPWRAHTLESVNAAMPVVVGDEVFISETYGPGSTLLKIDKGTKSIVWKDEEFSRDKAMQAHWNTPVYVDGYVYGCSGRHTQNADLRCVQWKTGKVMWSIPRTTRCSLTYIDGHFLCQGEYGHLFLFKANPEKFEPLAGDIKKGDRAGEYDLPFDTTYDLSYPAWAAPVVSHGLLYVRGSDKVICLELINNK